MMLLVKKNWDLIGLYISCCILIIYMVVGLNG